MYPVVVWIRRIGVTETSAFFRSSGHIFHSPLQLCHLSESPSKRRSRTLQRPSTYFEKHIIKSLGLSQRFYIWTRTKRKSVIREFGSRRPQMVGYWEKESQISIWRHTAHRKFSLSYGSWKITTHYQEIGPRPQIAIGYSRPLFAAWLDIIGCKIECSQITWSAVISLKAENNIVEEDSCPSPTSTLWYLPGKVKKDEIGIISQKIHIYLIMNLTLK